MLRFLCAGSFLRFLERGVQSACSDHCRSCVGVPWPSHSYMRQLPDATLTVATGLCNQFGTAKGMNALLVLEIDQIHGLSHQSWCYAVVVAFCSAVVELSGFRRAVRNIPDVVSSTECSDSCFPCYVTVILQHLYVAQS